MINYYHHSEPFSLELGGQLDALRIAYHTYGTLNADKSNVIWVCHALTGNSDVQDWWPHTVEEGKFLDPADNFIICANILGSPYGTTAPLHNNPATGSPYYKDFPPYTIRDIVNAHRVLAEALGIDRIKVLVGCSVGGFCLHRLMGHLIFLENTQKKSLLRPDGPLSVRKIRVRLSRILPEIRQRDTPFAPF